MSPSPNINPTTQIAYGYISANALDQEVVHQLMYGPQAVNISAQEALTDWQEGWKANYAASAFMVSKQGTLCPETRLTPDEDTPEARKRMEEKHCDPDDDDAPVAGSWTHPDEDHGHEPDDSDAQDFWDSYEDYEPQIEGIYEGVRYSTSWLGGALNFFIFESPHTTQKAREASPCVPNAAILDTLDGHTQGYDVPPDWRRKE